MLDVCHNNSVSGETQWENYKRLERIKFWGLGTGFVGQSGKHCQSSFLHPSYEISRKAVRIMHSGFLLLPSKMAYRFFVRCEHKFFLRRIHGNTSSHFADSWCCHKQQQFVCEFPLDVHILHWEIVWPNVPCVWRDFGSALRFQTCLSITKPVLPLSKEHGSQVKDQGYGSVAVISIKNFPIDLHMMCLYFPDMPFICTLLEVHSEHIMGWWFMVVLTCLVSETNRFC